MIIDLRNGKRIDSGELLSDTKDGGMTILKAKSVKDPCIDCPLSGLCGDDCGQHLYDLDAENKYNGTFETFEEWLEDR